MEGSIAVRVANYIDDLIEERQGSDALLRHPHDSLIIGTDRRGYAILGFYISPAGFVRLENRTKKRIKNTSVYRRAVKSDAWSTALEKKIKKIFLDGLDTEVETEQLLRAARGQGILSYNENQQYIPILQARPGDVNIESKIATLKRVRIHVDRDLAQLQKIALKSQPYDDYYNV